MCFLHFSQQKTEGWDDPFRSRQVDRSSAATACSRTQRLAWGNPRDLLCSACGDMNHQPLECQPTNKVTFKILKLGRIVWAFFRGETC